MSNILCLCIILLGLCLVFWGFVLSVGALYSLLGLCSLLGFPPPGPTEAAAVAQGGAGAPRPPWPLGGRPPPPRQMSCKSLGTKRVQRDRNKFAYTRYTYFSRQTWLIVAFVPSTVRGGRAQVDSLSHCHSLESRLQGQTRSLAALQDCHLDYGRPQKAF